MSGKRILFYGDSNTFGYDPAGYVGGRYPEEVRWVDILRKRLKDIYDVMGRGMNGRTIPSPGSYGTVDRMITGSAPLDYFAIMLGTNDILLTDSPDWQKTAEDMACLILHIRDYPEIKAAGTNIILISPPLLFPGSGESSPFHKYEEQSIMLGEAYRKIAKKYNLISISADKWDIDLAFDGVHISQKGSEEFADKMEKELLKIQEVNG